MNENDLRDCFAMFKSITGLSAEDCYKFADDMMEARKHKEKDDDEESVGIARVAPKRSYRRKS
jgi:hypothetical protein